MNQEDFDFGGQLLEQFQSMEPKNQWWQPFPMGVFGTLRKCCGNNVLMGKLEGAESELSPHDERYRRRHVNHVYYRKYKAFLPNFYVRGLSIQSTEEDMAAQFEVYFYDKENWDNMIKPVDRLESFSPTDTSSWGYHRTLVKMRILPDDYCTDHDWESSNYHTKSLALPSESDWENYPIIPTWVYSGAGDNKKLKDLAKENPKYNHIIWDGISDEKYEELQDKWTY